MNVFISQRNFPHQHPISFVSKNLNVLLAIFADFLAFPERTYIHVNAGVACMIHVFERLFAFKSSDSSKFN